MVVSSYMIFCASMANEFIFNSSELILWLITGTAVMILSPNLLTVLNSVCDYRYKNYIDHLFSTFNNSILVMVPLYNNTTFAFSLTPKSL